MSGVSRASHRTASVLNFLFFFFNDTATTEIYTLSLHDALPIYMRQVEVRRGGKAIATLDLYDYLIRGDTRSDVRLETGDVVFVPVHGTHAEMSGAVVRPFIYELKPGETLGDLIKAAGGFRPNADMRRVAVHRLLPAVERGPGTPPRAVIDVALSALRSPVPGRVE